MNHSVDTLLLWPASPFHNLFTGCYGLLMQCRQCIVKIDHEQVFRCIEKFNIWFLEPWSSYYFLGCDEAKSITHGAENISTHIVIRCFCRNFAHKIMMPKRVAETVGNSTIMIMIFQQTGIPSEASVVITSCSDKRSKKICSREAARELEIQRELEMHMHRELGCIADPDNGL